MEVIPKLNRHFMHFISCQFHRCVLSEYNNFLCMFSSTRMATMGCV